MTIWFDVEDLVQYFHFATRPTGIQRLSFETYRAIWARAGASGDVRFCRRNATRSGFRSIHFPALEAGILISAASGTSPSAAPGRRPSRLAQFGRGLPPEYRRPLGIIARAGVIGLGGLRELAGAALAPLRRRQNRASSIGGHQFDLDGPQVDFGPGDWFVNLGASWNTHYDAEFLATLRASGAGFALLAHDLIPELFPEWCNHLNVDDFARWLRDIVPQTDLMFANSANTAADLTACLEKLGKSIAAPVVIPIGCHPPEANAAPPLFDTPYVLMVGTIEARKNHGGMLRVWRRMLQSMPEASVPKLILAGKVGWLTTDLMQQLENANWCDGKIIWVESPSESDLANLYRHCLFSVFPAFYEGWGLPVTESLSFGKTVAASQAAAIPEAGGDFCAYFDPDNTTQALQTIRGLIENPARVAALEARIAANFRPPSWDDAARALLAHFGIEEQAPQATHTLAASGD